jgi:SnoaL-like domain
MDIQDKLSIQDLLARASYALDTRDMATLAQCFAADAVLEISIKGVAGEPRFTGRTEIMGLMQNAADTQTDVRRHVTTNILIESASPTSARSIANLTLTAVENGQIRLVTSGYYKDSIVRENGVWVIGKRRIELDMAY